MNRKIIYVYNPISGGIIKDRLLKKIETATKAKKLHFEFFTANPQGDYKLLKEKINYEKITDVVVVGGDGTISQVTSALRNYNIRFGIIPAGSGNGLAYTSRIPKNTDRALEIIFNEKAKQTDAFFMGNYYTCMLSGLGFDAAIAHAFAEHPKRGLITYIQKSILHFLKAPAYTFEIATDGFSFSADAYFISIANSNQFGNKVTIAPKASLSDGLLDIVIVQKMHKSKLPLAVLQQIRGNNKLHQFTDNVSKKTVVYFQTDKLVIKNINRAPLHIDGDPYATADEFKIEVLKDCFQLIRP